MAINPVQPLQNAKDTLLNQLPGTVPDVRGGILNYFRPIELKIVTKETINGQLVEDERVVQSSGMLQAQKQRLSMKPEGQRKWQVWTLYTLPSVELAPDDRVTVVNLRAGDTSYRVMGKRDWSQSGYVEYDLEEDYS